MKLHPIACAVMIASTPAIARDAANGVNLIHGHPIHHEAVNEAGVSMGLSVTGDQTYAPPLSEMCEGLRVAGGLSTEIRGNLTLEALFVVPYKAMAIEGLYLPPDGDPEGYALVPGTRPDRSVLDAIVARVGIPPSVLDETDVEHEISCRTNEPLWTISWQDVRPIGNDAPDVVIERARNRFMAIYISVSERVMKVGRQEARAGTYDEARSWRRK